MSNDTPKHPAPPMPDYLTVRQAAEYLQLNEKTIYALIKEGAIPATNATGKWLFPKTLLDQWLLESARGGVLTDRLIITGSDDPLLAAAVATLAAELGDAALVSFSPTGTLGGLELLARRRANICAVHWGPADDSGEKHKRLLERYAGHEGWAVVHMAKRLQGIIVSPMHKEKPDLRALLPLRWAMRQAGSGSQHYLQCVLRDQCLDRDDIAVTGIALSERHAAAMIAQGKADCAPGVAGAASEFGLDFRPLGWESFDLVVPHDVFFRQLFQRLLTVLGGARKAPDELDGYDLSALGKMASGIS